MKKILIPIITILILLVGLFRVDYTYKKYGEYVEYSSAYKSEMTNFYLPKSLMGKIKTKQNNDGYIQEIEFTNGYETTKYYINDAGKTIKTINGKEVELDLTYDLQSQLVKDLDLLKVFEEQYKDYVTADIIDDIKIDTLQYLKYPDGYRIEFNKDIWTECLITIKYEHKDYHILANRTIWGDWIKEWKLRWSN